jgi:hypothetical protein
MRKPAWSLGLDTSSRELTYRLERMLKFKGGRTSYCTLHSFAVRWLCQLAFHEEKAGMVSGVVDIQQGVDVQPRKDTMIKRGDSKRNSAV